MKILIDSREYERVTLGILYALACCETVLELCEEEHDYSQLIDATRACNVLSELKENIIYG